MCVCAHWLHLCQFVLHAGLKLSGNGAHSHSNDHCGAFPSSRLTCHNYTAHQRTEKSMRERYSPVHRCQSSSMLSETTVTSPILSPEFTITLPTDTVCHLLLSLKFFFFPPPPSSNHSFSPYVQHMYIPSILTFCLPENVPVCIATVGE